MKNNDQVNATRGQAQARGKLIEAFKLGDIYGIGGSVYDAKNDYVFSTSELAELRGDPEIKFSRIDAGGRPTWRQVASSASGVGFEREAKLARIESLKAENRRMMAGRCYECGARVETGNFIESGHQRYCFPCAAKGADID